MAGSLGGREERLAKNRRHVLKVSPAVVRNTSGMGNPCCGKWRLAHVANSEHIFHRRVELEEGSDEKLLSSAASPTTSLAAQISNLLARKAETPGVEFETTL